MLRVLIIRSTLIGLGLWSAFVGVVWADASIATTGFATARDAGLPLADKLLVRKSERKLFLLRKGEVLRTYDIRLGLAPQGQKEREGDFRTPEGRYRIVRRNPHSEFFLSLQVSYPNEQDLQRARMLGVPPGGAIMIHGLPNVPKKPLDYYEKMDWTDGCIAVSNSDMVEIWLMTPLGTPIEILP
jgi:murein L,D-transpeptidase YafK